MPPAAHIFVEHAEGFRGTKTTSTPSKSAIIGAAIFISIIPPCALAAEPIKVLCTGHADAMPWLGSLLTNEPMTDVTVIPTRIGSHTVGLVPSTIKRYMRLYFPRTYQQLVEKYDFLLLEQIDSQYFTTKQFEWMRRAVDDDGIGGLQDRSVMSMHIWLSMPWSETPLARAFPNDAEAVVRTDYHRNGNLDIIINEDPDVPDVIRRYRDVLNLHVGPWGNNLMIPRPGAQIYTWSKTNVFPEVAYPIPGLFPHIMGWRYGKGYTWSVQDILGTSFWTPTINPYGNDVMISMIMYSCDRRLPDDVVLVHNLRASFSRYGEIKNFIVSLIEFVDKFGAKTSPLESKLGDMDASWRRARELYLEQDYAASDQEISRLLESLEGLRGDALRLKDRALLWIYIIEWLSISGTLLVSGSVVWTLMVRRRLYRRAGTTRLTAEHY